MFTQEYQRGERETVNNNEKKYVADEIRDIAYSLYVGMITKEGAAAKLWQLCNELRNELKEDSQK